MKRRLLGMLVAAVVLGGVLVEPVSARTACAGAAYAQTFDVTAAARRPVYRIGETAIVDLFVSDSVTGMPVSDADAGLLIRGRGKRSVFGFDKTDAEGHTVLRLSLRRSKARPGWARALAAAWESIDTPAYCTGRYGSREYPRLFRIRG